MGKSTINGPFSMAMLNYQRVAGTVKYRVRGFLQKLSSSNIGIYNFWQGQQIHDLSWQILINSDGSWQFMIIYRICIYKAICWELSFIIIVKATSEIATNTNLMTSWRQKRLGSRFFAQIIGHEISWNHYDHYDTLKSSEIRIWKNKIYPLVSSNMAGWKSFMNGGL